MSEIIEQPSLEEIAQHYKAAMDSVAFLNSGKPIRMTDEQWADCVARNKAHLKIMLSKDFWTTEDLTPLQQASE